MQKPAVISQRESLELMQSSRASFHMQR